MISNVVVLHHVLNFPGSERFENSTQWCIFPRIFPCLFLVKISLRNYFKANSTSKKVIQIASTEMNLAATEANEVIRALADDKETPSPSQSSTKRFEVAAEFLPCRRKARRDYVSSVKIFLRLKFSSIFQYCVTFYRRTFHR